MYSKHTAFSDLRNLLSFCVKNAVFSRKYDPWLMMLIIMWMHFCGCTNIDVAMSCITVIVSMYYYYVIIITMSCERRKV